jgi:threonine/homoserine/homoserine lactone efflux protein
MAVLSIVNPVIFCFYILRTVTFNQRDPKEWLLLLLYMGIVSGITWAIYWGIKYGLDVFAGMKRQKAQR